nr:mitochondrial import receptor subunit TOM20 homolog isoform X2 [Oryctolagus cuniculus]XP_051676700.1 mitochondrial import receptor subunit TOM20 homolog isoform X2 [Oryctolagus cuniculus]XP_051676701.1 mitochondrial import receptor subunit TOM20 homolog isoform X2 [Oryctolagus cuniculus]
MRPCAPQQNLPFPGLRAVRSSARHPSTSEQSRKWRRRGPLRRRVSSATPALRHCLGRSRGPRSTGPEVARARSFRFPGRRTRVQSGAVRSKGSRPTVASEASPLPSHSAAERPWWAGTAPSPPAYAGPFSSGIAFTSTARDGVTPTSRTGCENLPDLKDAEAVQKFFLEEIQLGEELLAQVFIGKNG